MLPRSQYGPSVQASESRRRPRHQPPSDLLDRAEQVTRFLPQLWQTTEAILTSNPDITE
jgi:hypothetical protein